MPKWAADDAVHHLQAFLLVLCTAAHTNICIAPLICDKLWDTLIWTYNAFLNHSGEIFCCFEHIKSVRLCCGQLIIWVQPTLEVRENGNNRKHTYGKVQIKVEKIVSNSYSWAEKCVLLLWSQRPIVGIDFVRDEIWLVIACYTFAHRHLHMKWKCNKLADHLHPLWHTRRTRGKTLAASDLVSPQPARTR